MVNSVDVRSQVAVVLLVRVSVRGEGAVVAAASPEVWAALAPGYPLELNLPKTSGPQIQFLLVPNEEMVAELPAAEPSSHERRRIERLSESAWAEPPVARPHWRVR